MPVRIRSIPSALLLFTAAFAAGILTLVFAVPSSEGSRRTELPPCQGLLPEVDGTDARIRGIVDHVEDLGLTQLVYLRVLEAEGALAENTTLGDITFVAFEPDDPMLRAIETGSCMLVRARFQRFACGPACDAIGYLAEETSLRARPH